MDREPPRRQAGFNSRKLRGSDPIGSRPDRLAFWAVLMAVVVMLVAAGTGRAAPGGSVPVPEDPSGAAVATFYGPGFYGNEMACGETLRRTTVGVAHRSLPCGTEVAIRYGGRSLRTEVVDRGPYTKGVEWDLTSAAARQVRLTYTDTIRVRVG